MQHVAHRSTLEGTSRLAVNQPASCAVPVIAVVRSTVHHVRGDRGKRCWVCNAIDWPK